MKVQIACLSVLAAMTAATVSATAADFGNVPPGGVVDGGIRDYGGAGGVPVPAPVPTPDYKPSWYFRIDAGLGMISSPSVSESGYKYGGLINGGAYTGDHTGSNGYDGSFANGPTLQDLDPTWFASDFSNLSTFGGGVGYYLGDGWRMDATVEKRSNDQIGINGSDSWDSHSYYTDVLSGVDVYGTDPGGDLDGDGDPSGPEVDRRSTITVSDKTDVDGTVWMANAYYDLTTHRGFTPYVGAGLGFVWNELDRTHTTTVTSCELESPCGGTSTVYSTTATNHANTISLAAAAMVGLSYDVSEITTIDVGYRYLYLGGTDFSTTIDGVASRLSIGDQSVHQIRAGLRFNVN